jgi:hypothetical protein
MGTAVIKATMAVKVTEVKHDNQQMLTIPENKNVTMVTNTGTQAKVTIAT